jgi:DNA-binding SARP family transcriptional activator
MRFEVLGSLRVVTDDGDQLPLPSVSQRRLVSLLLLRAGSVVPADFLEEHLDLSGGAVRTAVSRARRVLGADTLLTVPPGYELRADHVDAVEFEQLLASAARGDAEGARRDLEAALALWRGAAYAEFADEEWAVVEAHRLTTLRAGAVEDLV